MDDLIRLCCLLGRLSVLGLLICLLGAGLEKSNQRLTGPDRSVKTHTRKV
mgnify:FL=1